MRRLPIVEDPRRAGEAERPEDRRTTTLVSLCFIGTGVAALTAAGILFLLWDHDVVATGGWETAEALGLVHVLALGFVTAIAIGVLYHVAPLTFARRLPWPRLGLGVWMLYAAGVGFFITALVIGSAALVVGGAAVAGTAVLAAACHLTTVMVHRRRRTALHYLVGGAVVCLGGVAALGITLAAALATGALDDPERLLGAKLILAIGGWLGFLITGFLYQLQPMFSPTRSRPRFRRGALAALGCGVVASAAAILAGAPAALRIVCAVPLLLATSLLATDMVRNFRRRFRDELTPANVGQLVGAAVLVVDSALALPAMSGAFPWPQLAVSTALLGWALIEIAANATRIVPFVIWQRRPPGVRAPTFTPAEPRLGWTAVGLSAGTWLLVEAALLSHLPDLGLTAASALLCTALVLVAIAADALRNADPARHTAPA